MSLRDLIAELVVVWPSLPDLIGPDWPDLAPRLRDAATRMKAAPDEEAQAFEAGELLELLRPFGPVRVRLDEAARRTNARHSPEAAPPPEWSELAERIAAVACGLRWITAWLPNLPPSAPLTVGVPELLLLGIAEPAGPSVRGVVPVGVGDDMPELAVSLAASDDGLQIEPVRALLSVDEPAAFRVSLLTPGPLTVRAVFTCQGNFVQLLTVRLAAQGTAATRLGSRGRALQMAIQCRPRPFGIVVTEDGGRHRIIVNDGATTHAVLPHGPADLDRIIGSVRRSLTEVVNTSIDGNRVYQADIDIPAPVHRTALRKLARAGHRLYQELFLANADQQTRQVGELLRERLLGPPTTVQVASTGLAVPWHLIYLSDDFEALSEDFLVGLRHVMEYLPTDPSGQFGPVPNVIDTSTGLRLTAAVNLDIDHDRQRRLVADQIAYWHDRRADGIDARIHETASEVLAGLANPDRQDHLLYFYCHAVASVSDTGPDLVFTGQGRLTLADLRLDAPAYRRLPGAPLVVVNACGSATLSPLFIDGLLPYLLDKGARGIAGTEVEVPAVFGAEWARRFFDQLLAGESVGQAMLAVRRDFLRVHHNLLGLVYTAYCDADTALRPPLQA
jgi:hypothetical protein